MGNNTKLKPHFNIRSKMNVRLHRLCRGHKPINRISRRLIVTESTKPSSERSSPPNSSISPNSSYSVKSSGKSDHRDTKEKTSKVHWALGEGYEVGRVPKLMQVRWNNDDRGVVDLTGNEGLGAEKWYEAAAKWD